MARNLLRGDIDLCYPEESPEVTDRVTVLDTRHTGRIRRVAHPGAVLMPNMEIRQRLDEIPRDMPVYTYCRSGFRSYIAYCALRHNGFEGVKFRSGGMMTYHGHHRTPLEVGAAACRWWPTPSPSWPVCRVRSSTSENASRGGQVMAVGDASVEAFMDLRAQHAEGPLWDAETARLWWVDITAERVHCSDPSTSIDISWATPGQPGGVVLDSTGDPVVATPVGLAVLDRVTGRTDLRVPVEQGRSENRANDIKVDSRGRAWVGTMAFDKRPRNAGLYRVDGDKVTCVVEGLTISNGPALDETQGRLYLADTALCVVDVFDLDPETGRVSGRRRFLDFSDLKVWPDGMTVDDDGMLWVALGREGEVRRYRSDGQLDGFVALPTSNPTSLTFGGTGGGELYITTSWFDLDEHGRAGEPLAGALFRCCPGVTGRPSPRLAPLGAREAPKQVPPRKRHR